MDGVRLDTSRAAPERPAREGGPRPTATDRPGLLAVRSGPAEPPPLNVDLEEFVLRELATRAGLRNVVGDVLPRQEPRLPGTGAEAQAGAPLPGEGGSPEGEPLPAARTAHEAPVGPQPARDAAAAAERGERAERRDVEHLDDGESQGDASAVAPQTGAVSNPAEERRRDAGLDEPAHDVDSMARDMAREALTQAATVEAELEQELVARYFRNTDPEELGPVPRAREEIGERSRPIDLRV